MGSQPSPLDKKPWSLTENTLRVVTNKIIMIL
jgi:hypothetical protein